MKRFVMIGAGIGLALGMPLFEVALLTILAIDGQWFDAAYTIKYFTESANLIGILALVHLLTGAAGALLGAVTFQARSRRRLRVIPGGRSGRA